MLLSGNAVMASGLFGTLQVQFALDYKKWLGMSLKDKVTLAAPLVVRFHRRNP